MINVRKLTTSFLVIAVVVSLATLSLTGFRFGSSTKTAQSNNRVAGLSAPTNGFLASSENLPGIVRPNLAGNDSNITRITAQNLAQVIMALNPYGPRTINGQTGFVLPTSSILTGYLAYNDPSFNIDDLWVATSDEPIIPAATNDLNANQQYVSLFRKVIQSNLSTSTLSKIGKVANTPGSNEAMFNTITDVLSNTSVELKAIPVPASFQNFQKSFLAYLDDQRNAIGIIANGPVDPLRSLFVLGNGTNVKARVDSDFSGVIAEYRKLDLKTLLSESGTPKNSESTSVSANLFDPLLRVIAENTFGIKTAHAQSADDLQSALDDCGADNSFENQLSSLGGFGSLFGGFGLSVPVTDSAVESNTSDISQYTGDILAILVFECQQQVTTQDLKASTMNTMNANELSYIQQASMDPRFITNYSAYFQDAATQGATQAYQTISTQICPEFTDVVDNVVYNPDDAVNNPAGLVEDPAGDNIMLNDYGGDGGGSGAGYSGLPDFGSSQVNGVAQGCQLESQVDPTDFYNDLNTDGDTAWNDYYNLINDPTNNLYGTIMASHDDITQSAVAAAAGAQAESIANQGSKSSTECTNSYTNNNGDVICTGEQIRTPGIDNTASVQAAIDSQYWTVENSNDPNQINQIVADGLLTQLQQHPEQGLYDLSFQTGSSLSSICSNLGTPSISVQGVGSFGGGTNAAQSWCNSTVGKILADYQKYASIVQKYLNFADKIASIISQFF